MLKTRTGRAYANALLYGVALDVTLSYLVATTFASDDRWLFLLLVLGAFWLGPIFFSIKSMLYKALLHFLTRAGVRRALVHEFRKAELPLTSGTDFNEPADLYFTVVAEDDTLPKSARLFAGQTVGQMALLPTYSWADTIILHANLDASLATYFDELRRDGATPHL